MSSSSKKSSSKSNKSRRSVASVGIGDGTPVPINSVTDPDSVSALPHLMPEGASVVNESVFDCIVYLIYCGEHDKVAVNNMDKCKCTWLPFVVLNKGITWQRASEEGVNQLIGTVDDQKAIGQKNQSVALRYNMTFLQILRIQLPSGKFVLRLTRFVHLKPKENSQCCQDTDKVNWLPVSLVINNQVNKIWGPELRMFANLLMSPQPSVMDQFTMRDVNYYLNLEGSWEQKVLKAVKVSTNHLSEIYTDYIEHCYPSFYMCLESFRVYLTKYGYVPDQTQLDRLYYAFAFTRRSFLDFHEFSIGLAVIEPTCSSTLEARSHFIYRYYDLEHKGYLNMQNLITLLKDSNPSWTDAVVLSELNRLFQSAKVKSATNVSYEDFLRMFHSQLDKKFNLLCRSPKSIFNQIFPALTNPANKRNKVIAVTEQVLKSKRTTKGTRWSCRVQEYEYANHLLEIDTTGKCVEPTIIHSHALKDLSSQNVSTSIARSRFVVSSH